LKADPTFCIRFGQPHNQDLLHFESMLIDPGGRCNVIKKTIKVDGVHRLQQRACDVEEGSGKEAKAGAGKEEMLVDGGSERIATKT
jgi:hypothetical protein